MVDNMVLFLSEMDSGLIYRIPSGLEIIIIMRNAIANTRRNFK